VQYLFARAFSQTHAAGFHRPMSLRIVHYNDPVLHRKGVKIATFDAALQHLVDEMIATMHEAGGIGLAAQQIGQAIQVCVVDLREAEADFSWELDGARPPLELFMPMALVNPEISVVRGTRDLVYEEGCLSFPNIRGDVKRPDQISVSFKDQYGVAHQLVCDGLFARCIQHEVDHLNGVLFVERMDKKTYGQIEDAIKALAKETRLAAKQK
jgi:peptide deformylase